MKDIFKFYVYPLLLSLFLEMEQIIILYKNIILCKVFLSLVKSEFLYGLVKFIIVIFIIKHILF